MTALPGFSAAIAEHKQGIAEMRGLNLTRQLQSLGPDIDKATGYLESHSPLFAGTPADPQRLLFTHDDPTY